MIIRGGENVYPREIEEFLYRHPKIKEVQVIGVPDPKFGEELMAWIQVEGRRDAHGGRRQSVLCQGQIARYKVPRYVKFVDAFPMTVTGKIQKFVMRQTEHRRTRVGSPAPEDCVAPDTAMSTDR